MKKAVFSILLFSIILLLICFSMLKQEINKPMYNTGFDSEETRFTKIVESILTGVSSSEEMVSSNPFTFQINPEFFLSFDDPELPAFIAALFRKDIIFNSENPLSNKEVMKLFLRAMPSAYPEDLISSWKNNEESGYDVPLQAIDAVMENLLLSYNPDILYTIESYDPKTETIFIENDTSSLEITSASIFSSVLYANATAKLVFENGQLEYNGESVYEFSIKYKVDQTLCRYNVRVGIINNSIRLVSAIDYDIIYG